MALHLAHDLVHDLVHDPPRCGQRHGNASPPHRARAPEHAGRVAMNEHGLATSSLRGCALGLDGLSGPLGQQSSGSPMRRNNFRGETFKNSQNSKAEAAAVAAAVAAAAEAAAGSAGVASAVALPRAEVPNERTLRTRSPRKL